MVRPRLAGAFSPRAEEANRRLAAEYEQRMGVPASLLLPRTRPHTLAVFLTTPIPLSVAGGLLLGLVLASAHVFLLLALPLGYVLAALLGYLVLCLAGDRGMAMGARGVTYVEANWSDEDAVARAMAPSLYHGWTHLAGRRGLVRLHNSLAIAAAYVRAREDGDEYRVALFRELSRCVEAGYSLGGWTELEQRVGAETRGPIGWLREWTKYQFLGHSRNAYVLGGLLAGRAFRLAADTGADPWIYLRAVGEGQSMDSAERKMIGVARPE